MAVLLYEPAVVVAVSEVEQCEAEFLDGVELLDTEGLLLEGTDEALSDASALGFSNELCINQCSSRPT